jgi:hypothetical protein
MQEMLMGDDMTAMFMSAKAVFQLWEDPKENTKTDFTYALETFIPLEWLPFALTDEERPVLQHQIDVAYDIFSPEIERIKLMTGSNDELGKLYMDWWFRLIEHIRLSEEITKFTLEVQKYRRADELERERVNKERMKIVEKILARDSQK